MNRKTVWYGGVMLAMAMATVYAQDTPKPLLQQSFEESDGGWQGVGTTAMVSLSKDAGAAKVGKRALQFDYALSPGETNLLILPLEPGKLDKMKSLQFYIKTDHTTPLVVMLQEKDGGHYATVFRVPGSQWQKVSLAPSDFILNRDKNDPKDPNGKLDLDKVENISILDMSQLFVQDENNPFVKLLGVRKGPHTLLLDDFTASMETLPEAQTTGKSEILLDKFTRPQIFWMTLGEMNLSVANGKPLTGQSLKVAYRQAPMKMMGMIRRIPTNSLVGKTGLSFTAAAEKTVKLLVQLEESGGGKYNTIIEIPGGSEAHEFSPAFTDFKASDDSKDDNNRLDLDQVSQIVLIDISGFLGTTDQDNTLWISALKALIK